jgi:hypothetical protein
MPCLAFALQGPQELGGMELVEEIVSLQALFTCTKCLLTTCRVAVRQWALYLSLLEEPMKQVASFCRGWP